MESRMLVFRVERHATTERETLGNAALAFCRMARETDDIISANFYWVGTTGVAISIESEQDEALDVIEYYRHPKLIGARVNLENAGTVISRERWVHPRDALFNYYSRR